MIHVYVVERAKERLSVARGLRLQIRAGEAPDGYEVARQIEALSLSLEELMTPYSGLYSSNLVEPDRGLTQRLRTEMINLVETAVNGAKSKVTA